MSDNDYVATAAAEKRLREVLTARLGEWSSEDTGGVTADNLAHILLAGAKIEYKPRTKQVLISLDLPDKATASKAIVEPEAGVTTAPEGTPVVVPTPRITAFAPVFDPDTEYEDVHFD